MTILAIDPGPTNSAYVVLVGNKIADKGKVENEKMIDILEGSLVDIVAIEHMQCMGMAVGASVFETCYWIGEMRNIVKFNQIELVKVFRKEIKMHHCGTTRAKDTNIRQAVIDRLGLPGTKKNPGATFGVSADIWSALAIALYVSDLGL